MFGNNMAMKMSEIQNSNVGEDARITGNFSSQGRVVFSGQIDGDLECEIIQFTISAVVNGNIKAKEVSLEGSATGKIVANQIHISDAAKFRGEIFCEGLSIEDGADVDANLTWERNVMDNPVGRTVIGVGANFSGKIKDADSIELMGRKGRSERRKGNNSEWGL